MYYNITIIMWYYNIKLLFLLLESAWGTLQDCDQLSAPFTCQEKCCQTTRDCNVYPEVKHANSITPIQLTAADPRTSVSINRDYVRSALHTAFKCASKSQNLEDACTTTIVRKILVIQYQRST